MNDVHVRAAIKAKVKLSIGTDAHEASELRYYKLGIATARRQKTFRNTARSKTSKQKTVWYG